ncbi:hypothetical protein K488DRAFT_74111 [Vararia minispora EC-137]|uniref:Uncharacterized protein n=1 Tax=Vararia minispora EC-137 TaxID=1314806 RepID=A0ACB8Q857_9AGAM|nr:hypothetical protein K488DRAFT_74111 [Vararia minispora EC-137]
MLAEEEKFLTRKLESEPDDVRDSIRNIAEVSYSEDLKTYEAVQERGPETFEEAAECTLDYKLTEWLGNHGAFCSWFVAAPNADQGDLCCYHFAGGDAPLTGDPDSLRVTYDAWDANGFASFSNRIMQHTREGMLSAFIRPGAGMSSTSPNSGNKSCATPSTGHSPGDVVAPLPITSSVSVSTEISLSAVADTEDALTESANRLWIASPPELSSAGLGSTGPSPRASCQPAGLLLHSLTPGYADGIQKIQFPLRPVTPSASECGSEDAPFGFVQSESEGTHGAGGDNCDDDESGAGDDNDNDDDPPIHPYRRSLVFDAGERYYDNDLDGWAAFPGDMTDHMVQMEGENALRIDKLMEVYWKHLDKEDDATRISRHRHPQVNLLFRRDAGMEGKWCYRFAPLTLLIYNQPRAANDPTGPSLPTELCPFSWDRWRTKLQFSSSVELYSEGGIEWNYPDIISAYWLSIARNMAAVFDILDDIEFEEYANARMNDDSAHAEHPMPHVDRYVSTIGTDSGGSDVSGVGRASTGGESTGTSPDAESTGAGPDAESTGTGPNAEGAGAGLDAEGAGDGLHREGPGAGPSTPEVNRAGGNRANKAPARQRKRAEIPSTDPPAPDASATRVDSTDQAQTGPSKRTRRATAAVAASDGEGETDRAKRKRSRTAKGEEWREAIDARDTRHEARIHTRGGAGQRGGGRRRRRRQGARHGSRSG